VLNVGLHAWRDPAEHGAKGEIKLDSNTMKVAMCRGCRLGHLEWLPQSEASERERERERERVGQVW
jgi:hypothetical protein